MYGRGERRRQQQQRRDPQRKQQPFLQPAAAHRAAVCARRRKRRSLNASGGADCRRTKCSTIGIATASAPARNAGNRNDTVGNPVQTRRPRADRYASSAWSSGGAPAGTPDAAAESLAAEVEDTPASGPDTPAAETAGPELPRIGDGVATADESSPGPSAAPAGTVAADTSPATLPELPSLPSVVDHIAEPAAARAVARLLGPEVEEMLPLVYPEAGEAIARIVIPSIDLDTIVVAGVQIDDLRKGPGHYSTTPLPGQPGNAAIAGHRTTYGAPFGRLNELNAGDAVIVETLQGRFVYRVLPGQPGMAGHTLGFRIVAPDRPRGARRRGRQPAHAHDLPSQVQLQEAAHRACRPRRRSGGAPAPPREPIGAEFVRLAQPAGPPAVPPQRRPAAGTHPRDGRAADAPPPRWPPRRQARRRRSDRTRTSRPEPAPAPAPELAGAAATGDDAAAGREAGEIDTPAASGTGDDPVMAAGTAARETEPPGPPPEPETLASGEATPAATGDVPGGSGSEQGARQAAEPAGSTAPRAPVTEVGFGEGLSGDRGAILPAVCGGWRQRPSGGSAGASDGRVAGHGGIPSLSCRSWWSST